MTALVIALAAVLAVLGLLALRRRGAPAAFPAPAAAPAPPARDDDPLSRRAGEWEVYARELAAAGRCREAVRAWYHAVLVALYQQGALHHRKGRTNWEYVAAVPPEAAWRPAFAALTRRFEREWYGSDRSSARGARRGGGGGPGAPRRHRRHWWGSFPGGRGGVRPRGRSLLVVAAAVYLLATLVWLGADRRSPRQFLAAGSALNEGERGTSLAREYLKARPGSAAVRLLERPVSAAELPAQAVVLRLEPEVLPWQPGREVAEKDKGKKIRGRRAPRRRVERRFRSPNRGKTRRRSRRRSRKKASPTRSADDENDESDGDEGSPVSGPPEHPGRFAPLLTADEEEWVAGGGRLVLGITGNYGPLWTEREPSREPLAKVFPLWPEVSTLRLLDRRVLRGPALGRAHAVLLAGENPVIARLPLGRGDVVLLSCPDVFHNARLAVGDHLALLTALAGPAGPAGRPVYFDERSHGLHADDGLLAVLSRWGLGPALLFAGLAALALFCRQAVRIGPPERDPGDTRSEAVDLVDSLGELYDRALSRGDAVRLYWEGFVHTVAIDTGLSGAALEARARELAAGFTPSPALGLPRSPLSLAPSDDLSREGFEHALAALNSARRRARDGKYDRP